MGGIIKYFIRYPMNGNLLVFIIFIFGYFGLSSLKTTFFPSRENRDVSIQVIYPGASPEEVEEGIVLKIENNLKGLRGVDRVSSVSRENAASIQVEVQKGYEGYSVLQDVKNAVDRINSFPRGMEPPVIFIQEAREFAVNFALSGSVDLKTLKAEARKIESDLLAIEGISKISIVGFPEEEIEIAFREADMRAYSLSFEQVTGAVQRANFNSTGGLIRGETEELLIRVRSKQYRGEDLAGIVLKTTADGRIVRLRDVADIRDGWEDSPDRSYLDGRPSIIITVSNTIQEDLITISGLVRDYVDSYNAKGGDILLTVVRDGAVVLKERIGLLVKNGLVGLSLVLVLLALFLNLRMAFWVSLSIPVSFMGMFIVAGIFGLTINIISLFGMILVIGILVDDGIVIGESIYQQHEAGLKPVEAAIKGTFDVLPAVVSAILTTIIAFSVFFFLEGRIGEFISDMAFVVIWTLLFSLLEGAFILPAHIAHSKSMTAGAKKNRFETAVSGFMFRLRDRVYMPMLRAAVRHRIITVAVTTALMILTVGLMQGGIVKTTFFPYLDRDDVSITLKMTAGTPDEITEARLIDIENAAWQVNEELSAKRGDGRQVIENIQRVLGPGTEDGSLSISLLPGEVRDMESFIVANAIRDKVGPVLGADYLNFGRGSNFGKAVSISLFSDSREELEEAKSALKSELLELDALKNVTDSDQKGIKEVIITLKDKAYLLGISLQDVIGRVRQGYFGAEAQRLQRGLDEVRVWVRYDSEARSSLGRLESMRIRMPDGREFPLSEIAHFEIRRGSVQISHLNGKREVRVEADMKNPRDSVTELLAGIRSDILPALRNRFPGVRIGFEGQSQETAKTSRSAKTVVPIVLILMFSVVVLTFRSFSQAFLIYCMLPLGFIGVSLGHLIHGMAISILSIYGIIALLGIMINDSLVLVAAFNQNLKSGQPFMEALMNAGSSRFRPILLTSITTMAGLGPLILETSRQAQFLIPMAISVAYGILIATFVTLIILPVAMSIWSDIRLLTARFGHRKNFSREDLEPAILEMKGEEGYV